MLDPDAPLPEDGFYVLVTGANSGLGFAIGCRLIDEFLQTRPRSQTLVLTITTRDRRKGDDTISRLEQHLRKTCCRSERKIPGISMLLLRRVQLRQERLDLTSLLSVQRLAKKLRKELPRLDAVVFNAGIGGWTGINWPLAIWTVLTDLVHGVTWPPFKMSGLGWLTKAQIPEGHGKKVEEAPLGEVFCANVFGHYLLGHYLTPLLAGQGEEDTPGRLIWLSSLEAYENTLDMDDIQGIASNAPYESSKRLTDVLALTAPLPATAPYVSSYFNSSASNIRSMDEIPKPKIYLAHPGICATSIFPLAYILTLAMNAAFYLARWLGSPWHTLSASNGACAPVWLALAKQSTLDAMEQNEGVAKWGSAADFWGRERVERTEVEGWGWGGKVGEGKGRKGRMRGARDLTEGKRKEFEVVGGRIWDEMEGLREEWERRLREAGVAEITD